MQVIRTEEFAEWLAELRDRQGRAKILSRVDRLQEGNPGVTRSVGSGVFEMKIDFGPGYRVYYIHRGSEIVILLCGGDKSSQEHDIQKAKSIARGWKKGE